MNPILTIIGSTASGKTRVCVRLADCKPIEVISADSRQIYRYMDIGTGKPTIEEQRKATHHLIDIIDPDEKYSAYQFGEACSAKVKEISARNNIPIISGGTILYIKAILEGLFSEPDIPKEIREDVRNQVEEQGPEKMHKELLKVDPRAYERIHPNDKQRIARALEIYRASGISLTEHWKKGRENKIPLNIHCLIPEKDLLYSSIEERINEMFRRGFVDEVQKLLNMGYDPKLYSFTSLGYREIAKFILNRKDGDIQKVIDKITKETEEYSSRQITFINRLKNVRFYNTPQSLMEGVLGELKEY